MSAALVQPILYHNAMNLWYLHLIDFCFKTWYTIYSHVTCCRIFPTVIITKQGSLSLFSTVPLYLLSFFILLVNRIISKVTFQMLSAAKFFPQMVTHSTCKYAMSFFIQTKKMSMKKNYYNIKCDFIFQVVNSLFERKKNTM